MMEQQAAQRNEYGFILTNKQGWEIELIYGCLNDATEQEAALAAPLQ